jgi:hypothetical protein
LDHHLTIAVAAAASFCAIARSASVRRSSQSASRPMW